MQYDPWKPTGFALDPPSLDTTLRLVGDHGWVARLVCRAFTNASCSVTESSIDSVERLVLVRQVTKWREPTNMCTFAARAGHLDLLKWARIGCVLSTATTAHAANKGHLAVLQWLRFIKKLEFRILSYRKLPVMGAS